MALHVHRSRPGLGVQRRLAGAGGDHPLYACQRPAHHAAAAPGHAAALQGGTCDHILVQRHVGQEAGVAGHHLGGHHDVAGLQRRVEAAGHAEADHAAEGGRIERRQQRTELLRIARTADNDHAGPGRNAGLLHQPRNNQDRPPINRTFRHRLTRGGPRRPPSHIPTPTILLFVLLKFRYRANAQSGKNFE